MAWHTYLTDLAGVPLSELAGAKEKSVAVPLGSMATASVGVRLDHDDADELLECDTLLKVVEEVDAGPYAGQRLLHFHGRQVTADEEAGAGGGSVKATWADPFWTLLRRLIGKSAQGFSRGTALAPVDVAVILGDLLAALNAESPTGARLGATTPSSATYVSGLFYKPFGELVTELGATLFGPDWRIRPIDYVAGAAGLGIIGELDVQAAIGVERPDAVFEYGDGLTNVTGYKRAVTLEQAANRVFHLPPGFPETSIQSPLQEDDATSQARRGLLEAVVAADVTPDELRRALLRQHIAVRANPRQTITFDVVKDLGGRVPKFGIEWSVGDVLPFRASTTRYSDGQPYLAKRIDAEFRAYQFAATIDDAGTAQPAVTVNPA